MPERAIAWHSLTRSPHHRSTRGIAAILVSLACLFCSASAAAADLPDGPRLGRALSLDDRLGERIWADGRGLPPGQGKAADGERLYADLCRRCHGPAGVGASAEELVGGVGSLGSAYPDRTVGSFWPYAPPLFDYIKRAMPIEQPGSLSDPQVYSLVAYLLFRNGLIDAGAIVDGGVLGSLRMPNRDGFVRQAGD